MKHLNYLLTLKYAPLAIFFFYVALFLPLALFVYENQPLFTYASTIQDIVSPRISGDPFYYGKVARDLVYTGWVLPDDCWIIRVWPPGLPILESIILKLVGENVPFVLFLQIVSVLGFSVFTTELSNFFKNYFSPTISVLLPACFALMPSVRFFMLGGDMLSYGEAYGIEGLLIGSLMAISAAQHQSARRAVLAGLMLALGAYFRPHIETILFLATLLTLAVYALSFMRHLKIQTSQTWRNIQANKRIILVILLSFHVATMPWRLHNFVEYKTLAWTESFNIVVRDSMEKADKLLSIGGDFITKGEGNLVCEFEPQNCEAQNRKSARFFGTFFRHSYKWYAKKLEIFPRYWFADAGNYIMATQITKEWSSLALNGLFLAALIALLPLLYITRLHKSWPVIALLGLSTLGACFVIFTFVHFEVRYFYVFKMEAIVLSGVLLALWWKERHASKEIQQKLE